MRTLKRVALGMLLSLLALLVGTGHAMASDTFPAIVNSTYPNSQSGNHASCQLCRTASTSQLNGYGRDFAVQFRSSGNEVTASETSKT